MTVTEPGRRRLTWGVLFLILGLTALAYWPGTHGDFLLDDYPNLLQNSTFQNLKPTWGSFLAASFSSDSGPTHRPIAMASFALNVLASGGGKRLPYDASLMKWTNVAIHLLNGILVFILLRLILGQYRRLRPQTSEQTVEWAALLVTAAWLLAPINLTAVLYVIQRMTSLAATFSLLGLITYVAGRRRLQENGRSVRGWTGLLATALVFTPLSIFTKEIGAMTMLYALVIEWTLFRSRGLEKPAKVAIKAYFGLFLVIPAVIGAIWLVPPILHPMAWRFRDFNLGERLLTEGRVIWHYLWWSLVPDINALTLFHDAFPVSHGLLAPWTTLIAWIGIAGLFVLGLWARRRYPLIAFGVLWFLAGQALTGTIFPLELVFEHRQYLPSIGLYLAFFATIMVLIEHSRYRRAGLAAIVVIVGLYGLALGLRSLNWSNPLRHLAVAARNHPDSPRATYGYGRLLAILAYSDPQLTDSAFNALEQARKVPGQGLLPDSTMIILANQSHRPVDKAWYRHMIRQLDARPAGPQDENALYSLVQCALKDKNACRLDPLEMQKLFAAVLIHNPDNQFLTAMYGNYLLNVRGRPYAARKLFKLLVLQHPRSASFHYDLGMTEIACKNLPAAKEQLQLLKKSNHFGIRNPAIKSLSQLIEKAQENSTNHVQKQ